MKQRTCIRCVEVMAHREPAVRGTELAKLVSGEEPSGAPGGMVELPAVGDAPGTVSVERTDDDPATWPGEPGQLGEQRCGVGDELAHGERDGDIERRVGHRGLTTVGDDQWRAGAAGGDPHHRGIDVGISVPWKVAWRPAVAWTGRVRRREEQGGHRRSS
jgi:hypothetical protein